jgi:uncharacterized protein (TIGR03503 family)
MITVFLHHLPPLRSILNRYSLACLITLAQIVLTPAQSLAQAPQAPKPSDVRIVIDISGSMKKNDPQNLRRTALDMLSMLMPVGSKAGVWDFGQHVNMLVKHRPVDAAWRKKSGTKSQSINSISQYTNIGEALEKAAYDASHSNRKNYQTHVILLTDGMVDIDRDPAVNNKERNRILNEILPLYQKSGYTIHTVSLSNNADKKLMDRLALATNGKSTVAKTADDLMSVFLDVFDQAVPLEELPLEGNSFVSDSSIEEFTALIFRQPGTAETTLLGPDNNEYTKSIKESSINWHRTDQYDLITVKRPLEGEWKVIAELQPQSRITVVSNLSLAVKPIPTNLLINDEVDLALVLREDNKVVDRPEFLELLDIDVTVNHIDNDKQWSKRLSDSLVPGNGVYKTALDYFGESGQFESAVTIDGKSFNRRYKHKINVRTPFSVETETINKQGKTLFKVTVIPQTQSIVLNKTLVVGQLKYPTGSSDIKNFEFTDEQIWELFLSPEEEGIYYLTLHITTTNTLGKTNNITPKSLSFKYPQADSVFEALVDKEPKPIISLAPSNKKDNQKAESEENITAEDMLKEEAPERDDMQWTLYAALGFVNILIMLVVYILYRKFFGDRSKVNVYDDEIKESQAMRGKAAAPTREEPPMDELAIDRLNDNDIDLAEDTAADDELDIAEVEKDPFATLTPDSIDDGEKKLDDVDPEFSLDDFAPDALDDDLNKE